jgi:pimeloyl-ACP methyl ester carboxylesterase
MLSSKDSAKHTLVCRRLALAGVAALRFDFAGRGESDGRLDELTVTGQLDDLEAAVARARVQGGRRISLVGSSLGGAVSILVAAEHAEVEELVTVAAPAFLPTAPRHRWNEPRDVERSEAIGSVFFEDAVRHDIPAAAARVRAPWLILHGGGDEVVTPDHAESLADANPGARLLVHPDADHRFSEPDHLAWLVDRITGFVVRHGRTG